VLDRYDDEIATADREIARLLAALAPVRDQTLVVAAGDHGEAFGEHGEYAHSIFVYDTTLRAPLVMSGPGIAPGTRESWLNSQGCTAIGHAFVEVSVLSADAAPAIARTARRAGTLVAGPEAVCAM